MSKLASIIEIYKQKISENIVTKFDIYNEINPQNFQKTACMKCILSLNLWNNFKNYKLDIKKFI